MRNDDMHVAECCKSSKLCMNYDGKYMDAAEMTDDEKIDFAAACILKKYKKAFQELAK